MRGTQFVNVEEAAEGAERFGDEIRRKGHLREQQVAEHEKDEANEVQAGSISMLRFATPTEREAMR